MKKRLLLAFLIACMVMAPIACYTAFAATSQSDSEAAASASEDGTSEDTASSESGASGTTSSGKTDKTGNNTKNSGKSGIAKDTTANQITGFDDFNSPDMKLGVASGSPAHLVAEEVFPNGNFESYYSFVDAYTAVKTGKVDGFAFTSTILNEFCRKDPSVTIMDGGYGSVKISAGLAKGNTALCAKVNRVIAELRADGTLAEMENRWMTNGETTMPALDKPAHPSGTLRILTEGLQKPFSFNADGEYIGFDIELGARIAYSLGMDYEIITMNFGSLIPALNSGKGDIILCDMNESEERRKEVLFSDSYYTSDLSILVQSSRYISKSDTSDQAESGGETSIVDKFRSTFILEHRWKAFLRGIGVTILISICAFVLGTAWGAALCQMERSGRRLLRGFAVGYCKLITGIPVLVWLMILYYIVFGSVNLSNIAVAIIGFGLVTGASLSGVFRTGLDSVDAGQREAAAALGFTPRETFFRIVFPQAASRVADLYAGQFVALTKSTSIVGYIAIEDLTKVSDLVRSRTYQAFFPLIATAILYFLITWLFIVLLRMLQRRLDPRTRRGLLKGVEL